MCELGEGRSNNAAMFEPGGWATAAMARDRSRSMKVAVRARWAALAAVALLLLIQLPLASAAFYWALLGLFALNGWSYLAALRQEERGARPLVSTELLLIADAALLTFTFLAPNPFSETDLPIAAQFRLANFVYFFILLAVASLTNSSRAIILMGICGAVFWLGSAIATTLLTTPDAALVEAYEQSRDNFGAFGSLIDPYDVQLSHRFQEAVVFLVVAMLLASGARRWRTLLLDQASVERERGNLAPYFSPNVVEELSGHDEPLKTVRSQNVGVLFIDIVGFTAFAAERTPEDVIEVLRDFHGRMERAVFRHGGTLDKYLGDGLMATFGTPNVGPSDALNALRCARSAASAVDEWNDARAARGEPPLLASFGLHFGPVVVGDIGASRLEYAAIGAAVNLASRLEALTREHHATIIASEALVDAARGRPEAAPADFEGLNPAGAVAVRGVVEPVRIWLQPRPGKMARD